MPLVTTAGLKNFLQQTQGSDHDNPRFLHGLTTIYGRIRRVKRPLQWWWEVLFIKNFLILFRSQTRPLEVNHYTVVLVGIRLYVLVQVNITAVLVERITLAHNILAHIWAGNSKKYQENTPPVDKLWITPGERCGRNVTVDNSGVAKMPLWITLWITLGC